MNEFVTVLESWLAWETVKEFANSAFTTSLVGALAGAFAGAHAAQRIAERGKLRDELIRELRSVNAAIALAHSIVNSALGLKKQHVRSMTAAYSLEIARHTDYLAKRATGQIQGNAPYQLSADFRSLPIMTTPIATVSEFLFSRLSVTGRPLNAVAVLVNTLENLNTAIVKRNQLIEDFKSGNFAQGADLPAMYLGLKFGSGHQNQEYGDTLSAIAACTDDAIFFANLVCEDLQAYGIRLAGRIAHLTAGPPPNVTTVDLTAVQQDNLMPDPSNYQTWSTAFIDLPMPKHHRSWLIRKLFGEV